MKPIYHVAELNVIEMSSLYFKLPKLECGRDDIFVAIEYCKSDVSAGQTHCWAWAQIEGILIRGLMDEYTVPYNEDKEELDKSIICTLNSSKRFKDTLPNFIADISSLARDAAKE